MKAALASILIRQYDRYHALAFAQAEYGPADEAWMAFLCRVQTMYGLFMREVFTIAEQA